ncbi:hypothetical protein [Rhodopirellula halodulae]|uniref:hypothetical protein n=1 Tax=Rhodopirellula halodulae TaxID=2894198 RepID=UPI001E3E51E6|nr:hypothetical protein [Rhodopirellula sp. JC737]MCC9655489.1 hypothetical protein [Rhodopirellula sp. JC737]
MKMTNSSNDCPQACLVKDSPGTPVDHQGEPAKFDSAAPQSGGASSTPLDLERLSALTRLSALIGEDAKTDAAIYIHRANTHHDGE